MLEGHLDAQGFASAKAALERDLGLTEYRTMACGARVDRCAGSGTPELSPEASAALLRKHPGLLLVDVREPYEQRLGQPGVLDAARRQAVSLSRLLNALPDWLALPGETPILFFCRSGNRSAQAARALRRLGHAQAWSLAGGLALWPRHAADEVRTLHDAVH